jgi:glutamate-1-semialdehyde 2,1-aminomutase
MQKVRFVSSGTEAVMTAVRLARGATGRTLILKFEGGYHGHCDSLLVKAGSGLATFGASSSAGVPSAFAAETLVCPLDDDAALAQVFDRYGDRLAAVVVEPLPANHGLLEQRVEWLQRLRTATSERGALLILDEVISGFRFRFGGYGDMLGVSGDLVTLGKIVGGGMPLGALLGPSAIMDQLAPLGPVYQAGTLSGNPVSLAAGLETLRQLRTGEAFARLETLGRTLDCALRQEGAGLEHLQWRRLGSVLWFYLAPGPTPRRADRISPEAAKRYNAIHGRLLDRGVYLAPSAYEVGFLSMAHSSDDVEFLARELVLALRTL